MVIKRCVFLTYIKYNLNVLVMKILSWDIGIKNLSYCWVEFYEDSNKFKILNWEIINLTNPEPKEPTYYCTSHKQDGKKCERKATWLHQGSYQTLCNTHRKKFPTDMMVEIKKNTCSHILVQKKERCTKKIKYVTDDNPFIGYCETHSKKYDNLQQVEKKKKAKNETEDIATNLIKELDLRPELFESDYILIENQPAFKNPKMKSIQMIVYTYYLMRSKLDGKRPQQKICFLMASNKLKVSLDTEENKNSLIQKIHNKTNDKYRRHKELSKEYCQWFLNDDESENWFNHYQEHKKKDDLADTFLMCIYGKQNSNKF